MSDRIDAIRNTILGNAEDRGWTIDATQLDDRHIIRRMVLKRCIYGVDKNMMAVELAKVSLWLHTFTVGAPLSFLDHHLRCGDSLFGSWVKAGIDKATLYGSPLLLHGPLTPGLFGSEPELLMRARFAGRDRRRAWAVEGHTLTSEAAMVPFAGLLAALQQIPDPRRRQGQRYSLAHLLLFAVLAILAGATSYRGMRAFIAVHREQLNATFGARFRRAPAVNTLRGLFQALDPAELEAAFRRHAQSLDATAPPAGSRRVIALDGKTLKRSFDHLNDVAAAHVLSAFACEAALILAHREVRNAAEEVPAVQALIEELGVRGILFTADALHGQKKLRGRGAHRQRPVGPAQVQPAPLA